MPIIHIRCNFHRFTQNSAWHHCYPIMKMRINGVSRTTSSCIVWATGPNYRVGSGSSSIRNRTVAMGLTTQNTRTVGNGPVLPSKTRHFNLKTLAPIECLSSDHIMTWFMCGLCSFSRSSTSRCQICDETNVCWVTIINPRTSLKTWCHFTAIQRILVRSQIWTGEVEERLNLHYLRIDHVMIWSELIFIIGVTVAGTVKWNRSLGGTWPKNHHFMFGLGNNTAKTKRDRFIDRFGTELTCFCGPNPNSWRVTQTHC